MFMGTVDSLAGESIQTKFVVVGLPLFPVSSHYVVQETGRGIRGFEIPLHGKSIGLAYLRTATWIVAAMCALFYFIDTREFGSLLPWAIGAGVLAIVSTFVLGRLSAAERFRRATLKVLAGCGAPPAMLPADVRESIRSELLASWAKDNDGRAWDRDIESGKGDALLFAVAEYHGRPDLAKQALANIGKDPVAPDGPYR